MKKIVTLAAALAMPLLTATAFAACTLEAEPSIPDGSTATLDQMKATQAAVKAYGNDYRTCLDTEAAAANAAAPKDETDEAKAARAALPLCLALVVDAGEDHGQLLLDECLVG